MLDEATYKGIEEELDLGQKSIESTLKGSDLATNLSTESDALIGNRAKQPSAPKARFCENYTRC
jgi:hypothetical protein